MFKWTILFISLYLSTTPLLAQQVYFKPQPLKTATEAPIEKYDTLLTIGDSLRLIQRYSESYLIWERIKGNTYFILNEIATIDSLNLYDITGDGKPELFIQFYFSNGHSGWQGGLSENLKTLEVYDLAGQRLLLEGELGFHLESWTNILKTPLGELEEGEEIVILDSEIDLECAQYGYEINGSQLHFSPVVNDECPEREAEEASENQEKTTTLTLEWNGDAFVQLNK